jgi:hypothetical protein
MQEKIDLTIEEIKPTKEDEAKKAFAQVFRDGGIQLSSDYIALAQTKMDIVKKLYANVYKLDTKIFDEKNFKAMTMKEALYAMAMHLKAIGSLNISFETHRDTINQVYAQINMLFKDDTTFKSLPTDSRKRIQNAVNDVISQVITNTPTDNEMVNMPEDTKLFEKTSIKAGVFDDTKEE